VYRHDKEIHLPCTITKSTVLHGPCIATKTFSCIATKEDLVAQEDAHRQQFERSNPLACVLGRAYTLAFVSLGKTRVSPRRENEFTVYNHGETIYFVFWRKKLPTAELGFGELKTIGLGTHEGSGL
jgi:hypothetical protein